MSDRLGRIPPVRESKVDMVFSYVVVADTGFAPNPFFGLCTLACCKPQLRKGVGHRVLAATGCDDVRQVEALPPDTVRNLNIWVVGLAGTHLHDHVRRGVVFAMQVTGVTDFERYYLEHPEKRPVRTDPVTDQDPCWHGDAIYTGNDPATTLQICPSAHSDGDHENLGNKAHDLSGQYVLLSDHFVYFGPDAPWVPLEQRLHHGRGHSITQDPDTLRELEDLLNGDWAGLFDDTSQKRAADPRSSGQQCRGVA